MRVIFAGTPSFSLSSLQALIDDSQTELVGVYTQPDRPAGRGKKLAVSPVKQMAQAAEIPLYQPQSLKSNKAIEGLRKLGPELIVVTAYGLILPPSVLSIARLGCINVHASLLPRWRGAAPIQRAIEAGDTIGGVTLMQMDSGLDSGDILAQREIEITATDTGGTLHDKLSRLGGELLADSLPAIYTQSLDPIAQDISQVSYAAKLSKAEAKIEWNNTARQIVDRVRGFNPWPLTFTESAGLSLRILFAEVLDIDHQHPPGTVIGASKTGIQVAASQGVVNILRLQKPGGKGMDAGAFLNGMQLEAGSILG